MFGEKLVTGSTVNLKYHLHWPRFDPISHGEEPLTNCLSHGMTSFKELDLPQDSRNTTTVKYKGELHVIYIQDVSRL